MKENLSEVFVLLVCNDDGVVVLSFDEFKQILSETGADSEWISAARNRRQMYAIKGSDGKLGFKVGKDEFLGKLFREKSGRDGTFPKAKAPSIARGFEILDDVRETIQA